MKKSNYLFIFIFALFLIPASAGAYTARTNDSIYIGAGETTDGSLYAAGSVITIEGTVAGDLICAAETLVVKGTVEGSVICAASSISLDGSINGNVRLIAQSININGQIAGNLNALAATVITGPGSRIGHEALIAAGTAEIRGEIGDDLHGTAGKLSFFGQTGGDIKMRLGEKNENPLSIDDQAIIGGNLYYKAYSAGSVSESAQIGGSTGFSPLEDKKNRNAFAGIFSRIYSIFAALVIGLVLLSLWRNQTKDITDKMSKEAGKSILIGFAAMFLAPVICFLLLITVIGLPLSMILAALWLIALYIGKVLTGILAGRGLVEKFWPGNKNSLVWSMILGIAIFWLLGGLPVFGWMISLVGIWWGAGGMWLYFKSKRQA